MFVGLSSRNVWAGPVQVVPSTVPSTGARSRSQLIVQVCVSRVPGSLKVALTVTLWPSSDGSLLTTGWATAGTTLVTVTVVLSVAVAPITVGHLDANGERAVVVEGALPWLPTPAVS